MLKNEDIICISSIDWDFIWQGHQEIMTRFARAGNRVLFIENTGVRAPTFKDIGRLRNRLRNWRSGVHGIRKIEEGLYVYSPLVLPFPYLKIARFFNKRLMLSVLLRWLKAVGFKEPIVWTFLPTGLTLDLIDEIEPKALIYYCIDSFEASSKDAKKVKRTEEVLTKKSDLVFVTSQELLKTRAQYNKNVHYFPFGVNVDNFMGVAASPGDVPADMKNIKRPIAGYLGGIHKWIDLGLVRYLAKQNKDVSFVFCGPIQTDIEILRNIQNVFFLGQKKTEELPRYVKEFDVALIPYRITDYTRNVYPTKLNEYLSLGKAVISTKLPEISKFNKENGNVVKVAASKEEFSNIIRSALHNPFSEKEKLAAVEAAKKNSWADRLEKMVSLIEGVISEKARKREISWKANMGRIYKTARKRLVPIAAGLIVLYLAFFHTPLIWTIAAPLQIKDSPRVSDVIVALGGGVGESGKVGQGHEERVDSAVKLYRQGLAKKILYSSGYRYIMKEAEVMKALSVFMGVRTDDIILDEDANNTYEMVTHLKKLAQTNGWKSAILVSSPYHMKRLKMMCDKNLKDMRIYYIPVEMSSFYNHDRGASLSQIRGILQEYLAIFYYKLKGYI
jgi:uncharacterized SAM-binding protein YcdF (DUF218 family)